MVSMSRRALLCGGLALALSFFATSLVSATTVTQFVVTSAGSSRNTVGTLNWAVFQANYYGADVNYISFNIPNVTNQAKIVLSEPLYVARLMVIDGKSQPGYVGQPKIQIDAGGLASAFLLVGNVPNIPPTSSGAVNTSSGSTIQGFQIVNYSSNAVTIFKESQGSWIQDNWMGFKVNAGGQTYWHNSDTYPGSRGIGLQSSFNTIRGNTISGVSNAITIGDDISAPTGNVYKTNSIQHNFIGTDPTGSFKIGNDSDGVFLGAGARENFIGPANVLSGMASSGVELLHSSNYGNVIFASMIGMNAAGTAPIPNGELGVLIANGATFNEVGGPFGGSIISGNRLGGVCIGTPEFPGTDGTNGNYVEYNLIGTDSGGTTIVGGQITGVTVQTKSRGNVVRGNVLVGEDNHGVTLSDATGNGVYDNWMGQTVNGTQLTNHGFGVYLLNASYNFIQNNTFGSNQLGPIGFNGNSVGNAVN